MQGAVRCHSMPESEGDFDPIYGTGRKAVYALFDPRDPEVVRYVGLTCDPPQRLTEHIDGAKGSRWGSENAAKNAWIAGLLADGVLPEMRILEVISGTDWIEVKAEGSSRETYWISFYDFGQLFNRRR